MRHLVEKFNYTKLQKKQTSWHQNPGKHGLSLVHSAVTPLFRVAGGPFGQGFKMPKIHFSLKFTKIVIFLTF
jgi:hypothetical protein